MCQKLIQEFGHAEASADQSNGSTIANVNGTYGVTTAAYQVPVNGTTLNVTTLRPDQIQIGVTNYLSDGTLYVNPTTNVVTADVTGGDGTKYHITASPDTSGLAGYDMVISASNGQEWTEVIHPPTPTATSGARHKEAGGCALATDVEHYFGGVAGVAGGVAVIAAGFGLLPVAAIAADVGLLNGAIAGGGMLYKYFNKCG